MCDENKNRSDAADENRRDNEDIDVSPTGAGDGEITPKNKRDTEVRVEIKDPVVAPPADEVPDSAGTAEEPGEEASSENLEEKAEVESDRFLRLAAEFDNYRKRTAREFGEVVRTANIRLLRSLIEIVDNFERAMSHDANGNDGDAYRKGIELIHNQLIDLLNRENVTPIESVGQPFDPNCHEALMQAESEEFDDGVVSQEVQKGYKIDDKVLRHARVVVSKGRPQDKNEK